MNVGIVEDKRAGWPVVISGGPTFIIHPITNKRVDIENTFKTVRNSQCSKCQEINGPGVILRVLVNNELIYECPKCMNDTFCEL